MISWGTSFGELVTHGLGLFLEFFALFWRKQGNIDAFVSESLARPFSSSFTDPLRCQSVASLRGGVANDLLLFGERLSHFSCSSAECAWNSCAGESMACLSTSECLASLSRRMLPSASTVPLLQGRIGFSPGYRRGVGAKFRNNRDFNRGIQWCGSWRF